MSYKVIHLKNVLLRVKGEGGGELKLVFLLPSESDSYQSLFCKASRLANIQLPLLKNAVQVFRCFLVRARKYKTL